MGINQRRGMSMTKIIGAIDQGTTSTRCILFDSAGKIVGRHQLEHRQVFPQAGWVEHDATEILERVKQVVPAALSSAGKNAEDLAAIGIANQRETTVVWDRHTGKPYYNAIVWQDTRTADICSELAKIGGQDRFRQKTGLPLATYFSGPKLKWILDTVPGVRTAAEHGDALFGTIDTWLIWNLTGGPNKGVHATDVTNASRTQLMNLFTLEWDAKILQALGIPAGMLPQIKPSSSNFGSVEFLGGVPIAGDLGDQQAALFGQACFSPGEAKNTYGTGCFLLLNTGTEPMISRNGLLTTLGYQIGESSPVYCLEGSIAIAGALVQWLRDNLGMIQSSAEIERLARTVEDNGGMFIVPAFSGLFAPYWRSDARGIMVGLTQYVRRGHIARAVLESTAYQTLEVLEAMVKDAITNLTSLKVDGGMVNNDLLMQFQADILNVPVVRPSINETTALGAAYAAGLTVGFWPNLDSLRTQWMAERTWSPSMSVPQREKLIKGWKKAVTRTFDWIEQ